MRPIDWKELRDICEGQGWRHDRTKGDHYIMVKAGTSRPVTIPMKRDLAEMIIMSNLRTMGLSRKEFECLLNARKGGRQDAASSSI